MPANTHLVRLYLMTLSGTQEMHALMALEHLRERSFHARPNNEAKKKRYRSQCIVDHTAALAGASVAWSRAVRVYREAGGPIKHENINSVFFLNSSTSGAMLKREDK
jgi:hypothetical protein